MERSDSSNSSAVRDRQSAIRQILAILHKWGIHTLGQLARLDKQQLAARLGPEAARMWERANGQSNRLLKLISPPESFEESFEFENEIETVEPLLFMLRRFLEQLAVRLSGIYLVAKELTLRITFTDKQIYERIFKIPQPTNTAREQFGLFETTLRNPHQLSEALARLTALLGADRVGSPVLEETHRPDAFRIEPFLWHGLPAHPIGRISMPRPALRRFRPSLPASVLFDENSRAHIRSANVRGKIVKQRGPY